MWGADGGADGALELQGIALSAKVKRLVADNCILAVGLHEVAVFASHRASCSVAMRQPWYRRLKKAEAVV